MEGRHLFDNVEQVKGFLLFLNLLRDYCNTLEKEILDSQEFRKYDNKD